MVSRANHTHIFQAGSKLKKTQKKTLKKHQKITHGKDIMLRQKRALALSLPFYNRITTPKGASLPSYQEYILTENTHIQSQSFKNVPTFAVYFSTRFWSKHAGNITHALLRIPIKANSWHAGSVLSWTFCFVLKDHHWMIFFFLWGKKHRPLQSFNTPAASPFSPPSISKPVQREP